MKSYAELVRERNREDRAWFVEYWANYVRTHPDQDWSRQQKIVIDGQFSHPKKA